MSLKNVEAAIYEGKKKLYQDFGEMLFTHYGVSGPLILSGSSHIAKKAGEKKLKLVIDLKPALTEEQLVCLGILSKILTNSLKMQ